jgi:hypothetical protein
MGSLFSSLFDFLIDVILFIPRILFWVATELLQLGLSILPDFSNQDPSTFLSGFTGDLLFFLTITEFPAGLAMVMTSLVARFILRRIPVIG